MNSGRNCATSIRAAFIPVAALARVLAKFVRNKRVQAGPLACATIDTVILDMDGTLLDLNFDSEVWSRLLPERYASASGISVEQARIEVAHRLEGARGTLQWYCLDHWHERTGIDLADLERELAHLVRPRPGAIEFLQKLAGSTHRLVLATNAHPSGMRRKFALTGIDRFFHAIASSHDYGVCKEAADFWPAFTADHAIDRNSAFLLDDNHSVLRAARAFGIASVYGVQYPDSLGERKLSDEFHCIGSFDELWDGSDEAIGCSAGACGISD